MSGLSSDLKNAHLREVITEFVGVESVLGDDEVDRTSFCSSKGSLVSSTDIMGQECQFFQYYRLFHQSPGSLFQCIMMNAVNLQEMKTMAEKLWCYLAQGWWLKDGCVLGLTEFDL